MHITSKKILSLGIIATSIGVLGVLSPTTESASLTSVSVTLADSKPSVSAILDTGNSVGGSQVILDTSGAPSTSTDQLVTGMTVSIGDAATLSDYTVTSVESSTDFNITPVLGTGDADAGDAVIATSSGDVTVRFTTANAIPNGSFRVLIPALTSDTLAADGLPDSGFFDFGGTTDASVTCPSSIANYTFGSATETASNVTVDGVDYHSFVCPYTGTGAIGTAFDGTTNDAIVISDLINPAPKSGHTTGTADSYRVIVQHLNAGSAVADSTAVAIGVIEAVRVTAEVAPQITFQIAGVSSSTNTCGITTSVTTTANTVPLGELSISQFTYAAQTLTVSTNASNGYSVTAVANDQLGIDGGTCTGDATTTDCIPDSVGDGSNMSHTAIDDWDSVATKGFGYTIDNDDAGAVPFEHDTTSGNCSGTTFCARQFADNEDSQSPVEIFSNTTVADNQNIDLCYAAVISATQEAADRYENFITYTATATF